ncbi:hypothetical protein HYY69_07540 [Candidatus Woesearchaeota archaeon]|nr:hypothetical protein [Candidatus Woesearchaeota archaeon]
MGEEDKKFKGPLKGLDDLARELADPFFQNSEPTDPPHPEERPIEGNRFPTPIDPDDIDRFLTPIDPYIMLEEKKYNIILPRKRGENFLIDPIPNYDNNALPRDLPLRPGTVHSEMYGREVPRKLYDAGIEQLQKDVGEAVLAMYASNQVADLAARIHPLASIRFTGALKIKPYLDAVDVQRLEDQFGSSNPIVTTVRRAQLRYTLAEMSGENKPEDTSPYFSLIIHKPRKNK